VPRPLTTHHRQTLLREALAILEAEYAAPLRVDDVAHRIATSRRQLQRCFDEVGDGSFRSSLIRIRMQHAADLLADPSVSVKDVAGRVGYSQPAQFAKAFHRHFGMPPSTFRARNGGPASA
jgi:AraC family transcriptional regulator, regulatory protein of adaptative response / methylphosphotriester-DNA alkyltransferase methyltransferase